MPEVQVSFTKLISLFLAEVLRNRRVSLGRAAEISRRVLNNLSTVQTETQALDMLSEIEKDFEEVGVLKQALHFGSHQADIKFYEQEVKEYAADLLKQDIQASATFLKDCSAQDANIQVLCLKYPKFCDYLMSSSDKAEMLAMQNAKPAPQQIANTL